MTQGTEKPTYVNAYATTHSHGLIRVFAVYIKKLKDIGYP